MYEPPRQDEPGGCRETWALTRAAFAVLAVPFLAMIGVMGVVVAIVILFAIHPALALLPIAALVGAVYLFARWEQGRFRPPGV